MFCMHIVDRCWLKSNTPKVFSFVLHLPLIQRYPCVLPKNQYRSMAHPVGPLAPLFEKCLEFQGWKLCSKLLLWQRLVEKQNPHSTYNHSEIGLTEGKSNETTAEIRRLCHGPLFCACGWCTCCLEVFNKNPVLRIFVARSTPFFPSIVQSPLECKSATSWKLVW